MVSSPYIDYLQILIYIKKRSYIAFLLYVFESMILAKLNEYQLFEHY